MSWQNHLLKFVFNRRRSVLRDISDLRKMRRSAASVDEWVGKRLKATGTFDHYSIGHFGVDTYQPRNLPKQSTSHQKVLFILHGGAFCVHSPNLFRKLMSEYCDDLNCYGVLPDYRLAPEHKHPAGIDDCFAAYRDLLSKGYQPNNIVFYGDSAGGGLVQSVLQRAIKENLGTPAGAVLISPAGDWSLQGRSLYENEDRDPVFRLASFLFFRDLYLNNENERDPSVSPLYGSFENFPPTYIVVGDTELMRDLSVTIDAKIRASGGQSTLNIAKGMLHDFPIFDFLPEAKAERKKIADFCRTAFERQNDAQHSLEERRLEPAIADHR